MKIAALIGTCLLAISSAFAGAIYTNGPPSDSYGAVNLYHGASAVASDSFSVAANSVALGIYFRSWEGGFASDPLTSVNWSITTGRDTGTVVASGTAASVAGTLNSTYLHQATGGYSGYGIYGNTISGVSAALAGGDTYYLNLSTSYATTSSQQYWEQIPGGTSVGWAVYGFGTYPQWGGPQGDIQTGNYFQILDSVDGGASGAPEPGTVLLLSSALLFVGTRRLLIKSRQRESA